MGETTVTARHVLPVRSPRLAIAGLVVSTAAILGIFFNVGAAGADGTDPGLPGPTGTCIPVIDPGCVLPTDTATATGTATDTAIPTDTATDTATATDTTTVTATSSIPAPTTAPPTTASSTASSIATSAAPSSSSAVPVGTLGTQNPNQDAPISAGQCGGLLCASSGFEAGSTAQPTAAGTAPTLASTGSANRLTLELSLGLLAAGAAMLAGSSRRVATAVRRRARRRH